MAGWQAIIKRIVPRPVLYELLLVFPLLYRTRSVQYETNLAQAVPELIKQLDQTLALEGEIIECGSARCGTSVMIAAHLRKRRVQKRVYALDSFEGFDRTELAREREAGLTEEANDAFTNTSYAYVVRKIKRLGLEGLVIPIKGYFEQTLPRFQSPICFALIDCDLRESIVYCAEYLWQQLVSGGCMVFDDYTSGNYRGARFAIDQFVESHRHEIVSHGLGTRLYSVVKR